VTSARVREVTVVGGGPAGCAAAIGLRAAGLPVTLVDQGRPGAAGVGQTLPADATALLARLGAWDGFPAAGRMRCAGISSAWGGQKLAWQDGFTHPLGTGWHIDRGLLDAALRRAAAASGARVLGGHRVASASPAPGGWLLDVTATGQADTAPGGEGGLRLRTSFLVDASGRTAIIGRRFGERHVTDRLMAVYARLEPPAGAPVSRHATIESGPGGWWYAATQPDGGSTAVFFSDADVIRRLRAARTAGWYSLLRRTRHAYDALGCPARPAAVRTAVASSHCLVRVHGAGWAVVGDAATAWDPLSSAGVTMALWSGLEVAAAVGRSCDGDETALARYAGEVHRRYTAFLVQRGGYYRSERRWPDAPFWSRRGHAMALPPQPHQQVRGVGQRIAPASRPAAGTIGQRGHGVLGVARPGGGRGGWGWPTSAASWP
jgi:flavin-dependent dehydrogenase